METRRQLVFWAENVFVLRKMNSYEKKLRRIARDRFIMEDWLWFVITALSNSVCEDSFSAFPSQWCAIKLDIDSAVLLTKKKSRSIILWVQFFFSVLVFLQGSEVLSQNGTLSIQNVSYQNAGEYVCVGAVPSVPGLMSQASVNLTVKGKSACTEQVHPHSQEHYKTLSQSK